MKLLETKEGIKEFYLYNDEEVCVYEDKVVIGDKTLPVNENECVDYENGVLYKTIYDKEDKMNYTLSRFNGNSFVEDNFRYNSKLFFNPQQFCSTEKTKDGVVKVAFMDNGTEHLFEFESKIKYYVLNFDIKSEILILISLHDDGLLFYTKTGERLWEYTVKEGWELSCRGKGIAIVDDVIVIPCEEDGQPMSVEGYCLLTGEKLWEVNDIDYCNHAYVMGPNKMLYALQSYYYEGGGVEMHLTKLNPFKGEVNRNVLEEGRYWADIHPLDTTVYGNKLFYVNENRKEGFTLGVVDLDRKELIEDIALKASAYATKAPIVTDNKIYVFIHCNKKNELRIYENKY